MPPGPGCKFPSVAGESCTELHTAQLLEAMREHDVWQADDTGRPAEVEGVGAVQQAHALGIALLKSAVVLAYVECDCFT